jgi:hypothetical protein
MFSGFGSDPGANPGGSTTSASTGGLSPLAPTAKRRCCKRYGALLMGPIRFRRAICAVTSPHLEL